MEYVPVSPSDEAKKQISELLHTATPLYPASVIASLLMPSKEKGVDFQIPVLALAGRLKVQGSAEDLVVKPWLAIQLPTKWLQSLVLIEGKEEAPKDTEKEAAKKGKAVKPTSFLNIVINKIAFTEFVLRSIHNGGSRYGNSNTWAGKTVVVEYSSPNIAKPFHCGHLRSTIIGNVIKHLYKAMGAKVIGMNYLGDWGKQFGLLAVAWDKYGNETELKKSPVKHLVDIYQQINKDKEEDPTVDPAAREYFRRMEVGDEEALALWKRFKDFSIEELEIIYKRLNVEFDVWDGESLQQKGMEEAYNSLKEKGLLEVSKNAEIVNLEKWKLGSVMIKKSDGGTLYITRDIAAAISRYNTFKFDKMIYVVGAPQNLHFKQLFKILELMGHTWAKNCMHVNYGIVSLPKEDGEEATTEGDEEEKKKVGVKMSSRSGNYLLLDDVVTAAQASMLKKMLEDKKGKLEEITVQRGEDPKVLSDLIGLSACVISDLSAKRIKDYVFVMERATSHIGYTGPYLQYTHARLCSIRDKNVDVKLSVEVDYNLLSEPVAYELVHQLSLYPETLLAFEKSLEPCTVVSYLFELAAAVNSANKALYILHQEPPLQEARMLLFDCARVVLQSGLHLLGLAALERM